jgi:hypothetical protein
MARAKRRSGGRTLPNPLTEEGFAGPGIGYLTCLRNSVRSTSESVSAPLERVTINFVVEREHYPSSVRMFHFDVAASAMNLHEAETLQCSQYLPAGEQR